VQTMPIDLGGQYRSRGCVLLAQRAQPISTWRRSVPTLERPVPGPSGTSECHYPIAALTCTIIADAVHGSYSDLATHEQHLQACHTVYTVPEIRCTEYDAGAVRCTCK
jgi:hypothetical protein